MLMVVDSQQMQRLAGDVICLTKKKSRTLYQDHPKAALIIKIKDLK